MADVLIVHASREGQTLHIAERLAQTLREDGHEVRLAPSVPFPTFGGVDGVMVAASVHRGHHPTDLGRAIRAHTRVLRQLPSAFLSVCLSAACSDPMHRADADGYLHDFVERTGWQPDLSATVAGALRFSRYGPVRTRQVLGLARREGIPADPPTDREFTDWNDVRRFAEAFSALLGEAPSSRLEVRPPTPARG